ncbi:uncharacterized protein OCT59_000292 [Rhizophagus irregularis]|uniref:F-box domain-containing protein n=2 Tax=Rhizophagus irregularis TaxID=588596 RepID=A0A015KCF5_RHIIW|nr:hypothetical protein GLOIN_2v1779740 [Rhizophagus irregularis DAOM 181602=DAOM 197198]EXX65154.1 hypothetical protein RirG_136010 [Rhizophagus irregularis DAOM 197198w]POG67195.1 hypothetical protein GLOIN_2v1779740 [Rhizophagus irregularis DAOM 181602=DAOM 197198]UZN99009.1 hypothetical protein OCT59_000292 [Rhizophagus irregularis]|eukprot:XP_025174061.1 hypothetical protein GLOIN_2v1779740 [Rhizophagus irregularis DAOM 181602=DAOM 197198]
MACSKIFSGDLPELIYEIVRYFRNDYKMLYSCILVNRLWCRLTIPLLWEDPFSIAVEDCNYYYLTESYELKNYDFIGTYLYNLNDEDKTKLNEYGIDNSVFPLNTLFNYPSFIKCLNTQNLSFSIEEWINIVGTITNDERSPISPNENPLSNPIFDQNNIFLSRFILLSLIKIFIENEVNLYTFELEITSTLNSDKEYFNSIFKLILQNPNLICNIKNLKLYFNETITNVAFLKCLYYNCNSISSLYFRFNDNNNNINNESITESLSKIINSQQNIKKILFEDNDYPLIILKNSNCSNTLKTIIFYNINFKNVFIIKEVFEQLNVLESVHIIHCLSLNTNIIKQIISINGPFKLKSLFLNENVVLNIDSMKLLLQKSGNYLKNIGFELLISNELKEQLLRLIIEYCAYIKFFKLHGYDNQNIYSTFGLIENLGQNLNYLSINFCKFLIYDYDYLNDDSELSSIVLTNLGQVLPFNLEYLNLSLKINPNDLVTFFKNSRNTFIKKLLIRNKMLDDSEDILPIIKEHLMKEKRINYLAIEEVFLDKREELFSLKDEVKEFELYNIKVLCYDDLDIQVYEFVKEMD